MAIPKKFSALCGEQRALVPSLAERKKEWKSMKTGECLRHVEHSIRTALSRSKQQSDNFETRKYIRSACLFSKPSAADARRFHWKLRCPVVAAHCCPLYAHTTWCYENMSGDMNDDNFLFDSRSLDWINYSKCCNRMSCSEHETRPDTYFLFYSIGFSCANRMANVFDVLSAVASIFWSPKNLLQERGRRHPILNILEMTFCWNEWWAAVVCWLTCRRPTRGEDERSGGEWGR